MPKADHSQFTPEKNRLAASREASRCMQGVNKVRALGVRADGSDVIFPKSLRCCNKDPPSPPPQPSSLTQPNLHPPPKAPPRSFFFFLLCNCVVRSELPPRVDAHWLRRVWEYSMRHLTLGGDWLEPVQLCK